jgi:Nif-specific regulatory protein
MKAKFDWLDADAELRAALSERYDFSSIIGNSRPMRQVYEHIAQVAPARTTVLIGGASGTGKELVAQAIHNNSPRRAQPFIKINCGALPETLIEAELFGVERGAFTDALATKPGRFELADGGTILLDEIGELSLSVQVKLLRVLESGEFERVGGVETLMTDARIIAATNRQLEQEVLLRRFRADLLYRLNIFPITLPALRERADDIVPLAEHFLEQANTRHDKTIRRFATDVLQTLAAHDWPGNVRELANTIERAVVVCDQETIQRHHLPPALQTLALTRGALQDGLFAAVEAYEKELVRDALKFTNGQRGAAARMLKISERVLSYKIKKYELS